MIELLAKYGIPLDQLNAESLIKLRKIYETEVSALKGEADKSDQVTGGWLTALGSTVEGNESVQSALKEFKSAVRALLYELVDANTDVVIPLVDALAEIKSDAMNERDYWVQRIKRDNTVTAPRDDAFDDKLAEMEKLAELIRMSYKWAASILPTDDAEFKKEFPTKGQIVGGKATDERLPVLAKLPNKRNPDSVAGRNAGHRFVQFVWTATDCEPVEIPLGTLTADVAHDFVSDIKSGTMVSGPDILKALKESNQDMFSATGWELNFPTGKLSGRDIRPEKKEG